jgi:glycerol-3-phosphate dehydrogenase
LEGKGFGINTITGLVVRGTNEMNLFSKLYEADPKTFFGLAGMGDLVLNFYFFNES